MRLPTSNIQNKTAKEGVRFFIIGLLGTAFQYGVYATAMIIIKRITGDAHVRIAFTIGFLVEMVTNYLCQVFYVFSENKHPNWRNGGGFILARIFNYILQIGLLELLLIGIHSPQWAGICSILIAGIINFFVLKFTFKVKKKVYHETDKGKSDMDVHTGTV